MREILLNSFFNPPSGGNDRGVRTVNQMMPQGATRFGEDGGYAETYPIAPFDVSARSGPQAQTDRLTAFENGQRSAGAQQLTSTAAGNPEMRNYTRDPWSKAEEVGGQYPSRIYDDEAVIGGTGKVLGPLHNNEPNLPVRVVTPKYEPNTNFPRRAGDGRRVTGR